MSEAPTAQRELEPHEVRVVKEQNELDDKIKKLTEFMETDLYKGLPKEEYGILMVQINAMMAYSMVLGIRISMF